MLIKNLIMIYDIWWLTELRFIKYVHVLQMIKIRHRMYKQTTYSPENYLLSKNKKQQKKKKVFWVCSGNYQCVPVFRYFYEPNHLTVHFQRLCLYLLLFKFLCLIPPITDFFLSGVEFLCIHLHTTKKITVLHHVHQTFNWNFHLFYHFLNQK